MRRAIVIVATVFLSAGVYSAGTVQAQSGTATEIVFTEQKKEAARQQLRRLLSEYDLDPWIITQEVRIEAGVDPHSKPVLTLNTDYLDDDQTQLSIFLHEQAHWLPKADREKAIQDLRALYPEIPGVPEESENFAGTKQATYNHIVVAWVELDAMTELVGDAQARRIMEKKVHALTKEPYSAVEKSFIWYNNRVLEETQQVGRILEKHDLIITPEKGVVIEANNKRAVQPGN